MKKDYGRSVSLNCIVCGASDFDFDHSISEENRQYRCMTCDGVFSNKDIMDGNGEKIAAEIKEIGVEITSDLSKRLGKMFRK